MSKPQHSLMEVTGALSCCARRSGFIFGDDTALIAIQHMLYQTVDLFRATEAMGLKPENIFALGKVYSNSAAVIGAIREMGVTVIDSTVPGPGEFDEAFAHDIKRLWETVVESLARRRIKRIIVLDDGGKCITSIPAEVLSRYAIAGVEQTSLGMFVFEENPPPCPVFSWARTAVKLQIGGHIFSHCMIDRLSTVFLQGKSLRDVEIGIAGLGSIGRGLADITSRQGSEVCFYDPNPDLNVPEYLKNRVTRVDSLEDLMLRSPYVLGASGRNPFKDKWPMAHRPDIKLLSASAGDQEFGPIIRDLRGGATFSVAGDTWDITSADGPSGPIRIAYLGFPYNFVSRAGVAVPTHIVQLETGGLLAGLMQARSYLGLVEEGRRQTTGVHRISPDAQRFVYELWLEAINSHGIDIREVYGYDPALLAAAKESSWFIENTEPRANSNEESLTDVEEMMRGIVGRHPGAAL